MRTAGTVQTPFSRSTSDQRASRSSPVRLAVIRVKDSRGRISPDWRAHRAVQFVATAEVRHYIEAHNCS